ncbi:hypothetical protein [Fibrobacter sp.]|uniref:hypothetical protein n=1 Tax=Fibrobacter sp. TaxID=35828 RepID=UPI003867506F
MKKSLFLLVPAAFGMLTLSACFDESSTSGSSESNKSACLLNPSETGLEIACNNESYGFLKTSSGGVYGSCGAEALRDDSGFKLVCGGDSVGVVYNGKAGRNGVNGDNGLNGQNGENGTSCEAKKVESGFELFCGEKKVGLIPNGHSCTVSKTDGASVISCEDGTEATVLNGINGKNGTNGINGTSCTTSSLKSIDIDGGVYSTITCGTTTVKIYDGAKGEQGEQGEPGENCTVSKNATTGVTTITCGDDVAKVYDGENGAAGKNGDNCSIEDNGDGTATITCGTGTSATTYTVKDGAAGENGAAGKNGDNCTIEDNGDGSATITCGTGTGATTYTVNDGAAGAKGDVGYSCSATSAVGYSIISCQTGVDADENPVYEADTILAAGYATCGDENKNVYNTLTHTCVAGVVTAFDCGSAILGSNQFCENGVAYDTAAYWTAATTYPKATYGRCEENDGSDTGEVTIGAYYLLASQICKGLVAVDKYQGCNGVLYNATTHFCKAGTIYALCGGETYDPATDFCVGETTFDLEHFGPCGDTYYDKGSQTCEDGVPTDKE